MDPGDDQPRDLEPAAGAAPSAGVSPPSRFRLIYPFDVPLLVYAGGALVLSAHYSLPINWRVLWNVELDLAVGASFVIYLALFVLLDYYRRRFMRKQPFAEIAALYARVARAWVSDWRALYELARLLFAFKLLMLVYGSLKAQIPRLNPTLYDDTFQAIDRALHFGVDPTVATTTSFLAAAPLATAIDVIYVAWYPVKIAMMVFMVFFADRRTCWRFFTCFVLLWAICGTLAILTPTLGPCFVSPELVSGLDTPRAHDFQASLLAGYEWIKTHPAEARTYDGIAAFPSLHVGMTALYVFFLRPWPKLFALALVFAALTELGSVFLGWHYAVDGYVSSAIAAGLYLGTGWLAQAPAPETAEAEPEQDPSPASTSEPGAA